MSILTYPVVLFALILLAALVWNIATPISFECKEFHYTDKCEGDITYSYAPMSAFTSIWGYAKVCKTTRLVPQPDGSQIQHVSETVMMEHATGTSKDFNDPMTKFLWANWKSCGGV